MTHTAAFEQSVENLLKYDPSRLRPLGTVVKANIPARIFPPGGVVAYSNYGAALAGGGALMGLRLGVAGLGGTASMLAVAWHAWRTSGRGWAGRLGETVLAAAG